MGRLVCALPLANYTLLRTLTAHLIRIVEKSDINKMTLRNIGIVFVPTLAVPAGVFSLMVVEFEYVFCVNERGSAAPKTLEMEPPELVIPDIINSVSPQVSPLLPKKCNLLSPEDTRDHRNSAIYRDVVPQELATAEHGLDPSDSPIDIELVDSESYDDELELEEEEEEEIWSVEKKHPIIVDPNRSRALDIYSTMGSTVDQLDSALTTSVSYQGPTTLTSAINDDKSDTSSVRSAPIHQ